MTYRSACLRLITWLADRLDVGIVIVIVDYNARKTGLATNLGSRFPEGNVKELTLDTLRTAIEIVKSDAF